MTSLLPSEQLIREIELSELAYMYDRMAAIRDRSGNPEGIEMQYFGNALCLYSRTMPWPTFNTVKGIGGGDLEYLDRIIHFYRTRDRKAQFEIVPSREDRNLLEALSERGFYQSGFHTSLYIEPTENADDNRDRIAIHELREDQFDLYATIHCRGTGLTDDGIPYVAENNKVLYNRPGWKFYIAYMDENPAAVGVMYIKDRIASLTFAATLPEYRNQGLQQTLLQRRIREAKRNGCKLAVSQCAFLSQSHRNMERAGMKIGYIRTTWTE
ncbi:GNAT family N-acetyltransferase [Paenibacillus sp. MSJ-34]|uniref:GNAT family N-acetyltransferase n=1 Tax=Paenibacillus sp. MSJ-34 TaxID=2841529 RepID=UPI001C0F919E|nr:GNAT family N-acetyltransferase [Paenibacillus sp. MSJ-34]MBU5444069.1 GNAT family N-acetyltransferase [Paenibacillus sp. MSJ-34]